MLGRATSVVRKTSATSLVGKLLEKSVGSVAALDMELKPARPPQSWVQLARQHAGQYVALLVLLGMLAASESWDPYQRSFYINGQTADIEYWKYSYPLKTNHVPAWAVPCIAVFSPLLIILAFFLAGRISRTEAHHSIMLALYCVATTGLFTNWVKVHVGRPRPHFVHRCWPNGLKPVFTPEGLPKCADNAINKEEGMKSFPSGHTSWSTSGLGYTTFWLLGKLRCFDGSAAPTRFIVSLTPLLGAVWVGLSRIQDYWHHVEDVAAGFCLGLLMAFCFYRQIYAPIMGQHAGMLTSAVRSRGGAGLAPSPSRYGLQGYGGSALDQASQVPLSVAVYGDERV